MRISLNILLVDADAHFVDLATESLGAEGHRITVTAHSAEALELVGDIKPDVVLFDPGPVGARSRGTARALRQALPAKSALIVLTASGRSGPGLDDLADLTLSKPIQPELVGGLIEFVRRRRGGLHPA